MEGQVITFGAHKFGQLGRRPSSSNDKDWFAEPTILPGYGYAYGKLASWVGAQSDCTFIQCQNKYSPKPTLPTATSLPIKTSALSCLPTKGSTLEAMLLSDGRGQPTSSTSSLTHMTLIQ
uniref:Uncharacterized protein n=1 Tax=Ditylenchus dipsaci TaxID=166011 RepID=A0A915CN20_9BILA